MTEKVKLPITGAEFTVLRTGQGTSMEIMTVAGVTAKQTRDGEVVTTGTGRIYERREEIYKKILPRICVEPKVTADADPGPDTVSLTEIPDDDKFQLIWNCVRKSTGKEGAATAAKIPEPEGRADARPDGEGDEDGDE